MKLKTAILTLLILFVMSASFASVGPTTRTNVEQNLTNPNEVELLTMQSDSTKDVSVKEEPQSKKEEKSTDEEEESVSILSVNIIFEIISNFNLRDLLSLPSK